jgi:hypothetical protein
MIVSNKFQYSQLKCNSCRGLCGSQCIFVSAEIFKLQNEIKNRFFDYMCFVNKKTLINTIC